MDHYPAMSLELERERLNAFFQFGQSVDCVVFGFDGVRLQILVIERGVEPFYGSEALPGDLVRIDIKARTLDLLVDLSELESRKVGWNPLPHKFKRGVLAKYSKTVGSASKGAVCG